MPANGCWTNGFAGKRVSIWSVRLPQRKIYPTRVKELKKFIEEKGQPCPIVLWKNFISRGLHIWEAMVELGYTEIEVKDCDCKSCLREKNEK